VSVVLSKKLYMYMCPIPTVSEIEQFHCADEQHAVSSHGMQSVDGGIFENVLY
jgi:hypothetical protein